ncbi:Pectin lyase fold [Phytophthora cactorum]|nr:Pectin lyase fold [Phytophthora cactorum]
MLQEFASPGNSTEVCTGEQTRTQPPPGAIVVDATGAYSGSYKTVAEGVAHIPNTTDEHTLFVFPGVYHEQVVVPKLNGPLVLQGYTCDTMSYAANEVTITQAKAQKDIPPEIKDNRNFLTTTLGFKSASGVKVYNLNVANTAGKIEELARRWLCMSTTRLRFLRLQLHRVPGHSVCSQGPRVSMAWFESCELESVGEGWVTANGNKNGTIASEYVFNKARVFSSNDSMNGTTHLGRPWGEYARVVFQNSELDDVVNLEGWAPWDEETSTDNVYFKEFNNNGPERLLTSVWLTADSWMLLWTSRKSSVTTTSRNGGWTPTSLRSKIQVLNLLIVQATIQKLTYYNTSSPSSPLCCIYAYDKRNVVP